MEVLLRGMYAALRKRQLINLESLTACVLDKPKRQTNVRIHSQPFLLAVSLKPQSHAVQIGFSAVPSHPLQLGPRCAWHFSQLFLSAARMVLPAQVVQPELSQAQHFSPYRDEHAETQGNGWKLVTVKSGSV